MTRLGLPYPDSPEEINLLLSKREKHKPHIFSVGERYHVENEVRRHLSNLGLGKKVLKKVTLDSVDQSLIDAYSVHRANTQINEACNKLWAVVEIVNLVSPKIWKTEYSPIGERFERNYLLGTIIPTLYYSQVSALVSVMSIFGCVSIKDTISKNKSRKIIMYNLVRTKEGWQLFKREHYLKDILGIDPSKGWHRQVIQLVEGLSANLQGFPKIDVQATKELRRARNRTHYEILASVSTKPVMGIDNFFHHLPLVVSTISTVITTIEKCYKPSKLSYTKRFKNLYQNLPKLYKAYDKKFPTKSHSNI